MIRNCTLDPGGSNNLLHEKILPLSLSIQGTVGNLCIDSSILGPVCIEASGVVEELSISDSVVQSVDASVTALNIDTGKSVIQRSTIFGDALLHRIEASEAFFTETSL